MKDNVKNIKKIFVIIVSFLLLALFMLGFLVIWDFIDFATAKTSTIKIAYTLGLFLIVFIILLIIRKITKE